MHKHITYLVIDNVETLDIDYNFIDGATERQSRNMETKQVSNGQCFGVEREFHKMFHLR